MKISARKNGLNHICTFAKVILRYRDYFNVTLNRKIIKIDEFFLILKKQTKIKKATRILILCTLSRVYFSRGQKEHVIKGEKCDFKTSAVCRH